MTVRKVSSPREGLPAERRDSGVSGGAHQTPPAFSFAVELPLPPKMLSPNVRAHWAPKARAVKGYREVAAWEIRRAYGFRRRAVLPHVTIDVQYRCPHGAAGYVAYDEQNAIAALKSALDGLADAGIVKSDSKKYVSWGSIELVTTARELARLGKTEGVTITVRSA